MENLFTWTQEERDLLATYQRKQEVVKGIVRAAAIRKMPVRDENGRVSTKDVEVAIIQVQGGVRAFCPIDEFAEHRYKSLNGFVGSTQNIIITRLDLENQIAIGSVKEADKKTSTSFWEEIKLLEQNKQLKDRHYEATVWGYNEKSGRIFVRINGQDCFMMKHDWDYSKRIDLSVAIQRGETIHVKVLRFDEEREIVQVSRKAAMVNPFDRLLELAEFESIVGRVTTVDPIHGIFVQLDEGLEVKGMKPHQLPEPLPNELVTCKVRSVDRKNERAKVVIIGYPQGKKKKKDLGDFLFA
ncbi:S1 RNA-binding domain-containing protein [Bacillus salitolerans]|uniref:S1 RNA-binding domain-containing protein n=1 Tax=Bacillus salitolerans TaxID=1437434 RepID=A0ABW4LM22_9BACI